MASIFFAAHDPGPARLIAALVEPARRRGHAVSLVGAGPALALWRSLGESVFETEPDAPVLPAPPPDIIVTGTGSTELERTLWSNAPAQKIPAIGLLESWVNVSSRFLRNQVDIQPTGLGVLDDELRDMITAEGWCNAEITVIGQPHLQGIIARLTAKRSRRADKDQATVLFLSEVMPPDSSPDWRGFQQFDVASGVFEGLRNTPGLSLVICPHPREDAALWRQWLAARVMPDRVRVEFNNTLDSEDLLVDADYAIGITSMMLIEAHLLGVPVLSLQPGRNGRVFPLLDDIINVVTDPGALGEAVRKFVSREVACMPVSPRLSQVISNADNRALDMIERHLEASQR